MKIIYFFTFKVTEYFTTTIFFNFKIKETAHFQRTLYATLDKSKKIW